MAAVGADRPTYGVLVDMLETAETETTSSGQSVAELLTTTFHQNFPHIPIGRPSRFLDTVRKIAAPTRPSVIGQKRLNGSPLRSYLNRCWSPRIRTRQRYIAGTYD